MADEFDSLTDALRWLVNEYPGLSLAPSDDGILFTTLSENSGKSIWPVSGALLETKKESITGLITKTCLYPFVTIYRASGLSENRKAAVKDWLDDFAKWLEREPVYINGQTYKLQEYPRIKGGLEILDITAQSPSYMDSTNEDKTEDWAVAISARYRYTYHK